MKLEKLAWRGGGWVKLLVEKAELESAMGPPLSFHHLPIRAHLPSFGIPTCTPSIPPLSIDATSTELRAPNTPTALTRREAMFSLRRDQSSQLPD